MPNLSKDGTGTKGMDAMPDDETGSMHEALSDMRAFGYTVRTLPLHLQYENQTEKECNDE